ncbi:L,D-transpeptidase family protein [Solitalea lacus]|uniref:L,D-transpeptidase family protein n=1 Tax=Solitalea lacus TaxID=2911172 RepID=UPI001EDA21E2|nr:L,D-transpeptidase family protein [Solitalea lacus]UKJ05784.1 L,D-transpeptidase family protein [Solitalea lacus]
MKLKTTIILYTLFPVLLSSCVGKHNKPNLKPVDTIINVSNWNRTIPGNYSSQTAIHLDSITLNNFINKYPLLSSYQTDITKFYKNRNFAFAWFDRKGLIEQASNLNNRVQHLDEEGLNGKIPYDSKLDSLIHSIINNKPDATTELMLTGAYFAFSKIAWQGSVNDKEMQELEWFLPRKKIDFQKQLEDIINQPASNVLSKTPVFRQYDLLKDNLKLYRKLTTNENWESLKLDQKTYNPGDSSSLLLAIRHRLFLLGDLKKDNKNPLFDAELIMATKQFQTRHGLTADGVIGNSFINELNIKPSERLKQLMVNIERSRWVPEKVEGKHIIINIPAFKLYIFNSDTLEWGCNVVVGKVMHQTVIFNGNLRYIVFSPYWNVPPSITRNEILPEMSKNSNYLRDHNMEITGYMGQLPVLRQLPGPTNSLGQVKFLFPNTYNIYLHDTPSKSLFKEDQRAFSHGCIRVSEPKKLAELLLKDDNTWTSDKITEAMNANQELYVTLKKSVPVYIGYFTAFVDHNGLLNFRKDVYKKDNRLEEMLFSKN